MAAQALQEDPRILRIFISYASEDRKIADAIQDCLREALDDRTFSDIFLDEKSLEAGLQYRDQLKETLEGIDVLIIVYTGADKPSHSFTGWEVGYFESTVKAHPDRRIVHISVGDPPPAAEAYEGIQLKIRDYLPHPESFVAAVAKDNPMCRLIEDLQDRLGKLRETQKFKRASQTRDPAIYVERMRLAIFQYLRATVYVEHKPQKQIKIRTTGAALKGRRGDLPGDASLIPVGAGPMGIFGLGDREMKWEDFLHLAPTGNRDSWREAISKVVASGEISEVNVDNSQIVVSSDGSKTYRVVLTTATTNWDDTCEFDLCFFDKFSRDEYGDEDTTLLLKGLQLVCRYRFMFLELKSEFSSDNILASNKELPETAAKLLRELDLIRSESVAAKLDDPAVWAGFVNGWSKIHEMSSIYRPREDELRKVLGEILHAKGRGEAEEGLRKRLSDAVGEIENLIRPHNTFLIKEMAGKLLELVRAEERG